MWMRMLASVKGLFPSISSKTVNGTTTLSLRIQFFFLVCPYCSADVQIKESGNKIDLDINWTHFMKIN